MFAKFLLPILALVLAAQAQAEPRTFKITSGDERNMVQFRSEAQTETVIGRTRNASGSITLDPESETPPAQAEIHVDLASLKTGIDMRDRHMRENHLQTDKYPEAVFTLTSLSMPVGRLNPDGRTPVKVEGTLLLHGVEKTVQPETYLTYSEGNGRPTLRIESKFTVKLADYNIPRPQFLVMRLADEQKIEVDLTAE